MKRIDPEMIEEILSFWEQYYTFEKPKIIAFSCSPKGWSELWDLRKLYNETVEQLMPYFEEKGLVKVIKVNGKAHVSGLPELSSWMKHYSGFHFITKTYTQLKTFEPIKKYREFLDLLSKFKHAIFVKRSDFELALFEELTHVVEDEAETTILPHNPTESEKAVRNLHSQFIKWKAIIRSM